MIGIESSRTLGGKAKNPKSAGFPLHPTSITEVGGMHEVINAGGLHELSTRIPAANGKELGPVTRLPA